MQNVAWPTYLENIVRDDTYGNHLTLQAAEELFIFDFIVIFSLGPAATTVIYLLQLSYWSVRRRRWWALRRVAKWFHLARHLWTEDTDRIKHTASIQQKQGSRAIMLIFWNKQHYHLGHCWAQPRPRSNQRAAWVRSRKCKSTSVVTSNFLHYLSIFAMDCSCYLIRAICLHTLIGYLAHA